MPVKERVREVVVYEVRQIFLPRGARTDILIRPEVGDPTAAVMDREVTCAEWEQIFKNLAKLGEAFPPDAKSDLRAIRKAGASGARPADFLKSYKNLVDDCPVRSYIPSEGGSRIEFAMQIGSGLNKLLTAAGITDYQICPVSMGDIVNSPIRLYCLEPIPLAA